MGVEGDNVAGLHRRRNGQTLRRQVLAEPQRLLGSLFHAATVHVVAVDAHPLDGAILDSFDRGSGIQASARLGDEPFALLHLQFDSAALGIDIAQGHLDIGRDLVKRGHALLRHAEQLNFAGGLDWVEHPGKVRVFVEGDFKAAQG